MSLLILVSSETHDCLILYYAAYRPEATGVDVFNMGFNCIEQSTEWSACSKTCGVGHSYRVTNRNRRCEMQKQIRLCMVRPCEEEDQELVEKVNTKQIVPNNVELEVSSDALGMVVRC